MAQPYSRTIIGGLPWYSVLIAIGMTIAILLSCSEEKRLHLPEDLVVDLCLRMIPIGIIGARLYYCIFAWNHFQGNPISVLYLWEGGLAIYGGLIGALLAIVCFCHKRQLPLLRVLDIVIVGVPLAQAIGRWGNYFNQEAYGLLVTQPKWQFFPLSVLIGQGETAQWHMATFFYESIWDLVIFACIWLHRKKKSFEGELFLLYTVLYAAGRQLIEGLRMDSLTAGEIRVSQLLAMLACVSGIILLARRHPFPLQKKLSFGIAGFLTGLLLCRCLLPGDALFWQTIVSGVFLLLSLIGVLWSQIQPEKGGAD